MEEENEETAAQGTSCSLTQQGEKVSIRVTTGTGKSSGAQPTYSSIQWIHDQVFKARVGQSWKDAFQAEFGKTVSPKQFLIRFVANKSRSVMRHALTEPIRNIIKYPDPGVMYKVTLVRFPWTPKQYSKYSSALSPSAIAMYKKGRERNYDQLGFQVSSDDDDDDDDPYEEDGGGGSSGDNQSESVEVQVSSSSSSPPEEEDELHQRRSTRSSRGLRRWSYDDDDYDDDDEDWPEEEKKTDKDDEDYQAEAGKKKRRPAKSDRSVSAPAIQITAKKRKVALDEASTSKNNPLFSSSQQRGSQAQGDNNNLKRAFFQKLSKLSNGQLLLAQRALQQLKENRGDDEEKGRQRRDPWTDWLFKCPMATSIIRQLLDV